MQSLPNQEKQRNPWEFQRKSKETLLVQVMQKKSDLTSKTGQILK